MLVFVKSSSATFYLFIGLTVLCAAGVLCIVFLLPALGEVATDAETATLEDPAAPLKPRTESEVPTRPCRPPPRPHTSSSSASARATFCIVGSLAPTTLASGPFRPRRRPPHDPH